MLSLNVKLYENGMAPAFVRTGILKTTLRLWRLMLSCQLENAGMPCATCGYIGWATRSAPKTANTRSEDVATAKRTIVPPEVNKLWAVAAREKQRRSRRPEMRYGKV